MQYKLLFITVLALVGSFPNSAYAYIDPMTGSIIVNALIAGAIAGMAFLKIYWYHLKAFLNLGPPKQDNMMDIDSIDDLPEDKRAIVFYAEDTNSCQHFSPIIEYLTDEMSRYICYLTSSKDDPILTSGNKRILSFYIGDGMNRNLVFRSLDAKVMVLTAPDLDTYQLKRSLNPVHYVYIFHNMVSSHMTFTETAFDNFDTIFCVGPHHVTEIREAEVRRNLPQKELFEHGYGQLDKILTGTRSIPDSNRQPKILIAPSWGEHGILETIGAELIDTLLAENLDVSVRPHPLTRQKTAHVLDEITDLFAGQHNFTMHESIASLDELLEADILISDWSGVAMEFAFGVEKPVIFIDVPRKVLNPNYENLKAVPLEVQFRNEVGTIVSPNALETLPKKINELLSNSVNMRKKIVNCREKWVFNHGRSGEAAAKKIVSLADRGISLNDAVQAKT